jgi:hypothetical protein
MKANEIQKYFIKFVLAFLFISLLTFILATAIKYIYYGFSYKEGLKQIYNSNELLEYNPDSPLTVQDVDVVNNFYTCKNFCGPKAQCAITREQCVADIDCQGCVPPTLTPQNNDNDKNKNNSKTIESFTQLSSCDMPQNDVAAGKLTFSQTPQYSSLTTDIGAFARVINNDNKVPRMYEGIDKWTKSFNYGLKLAYSKLPKLSASEELIKPDYPLSVTATGNFYDLGPPPSNSTI